MASAAQVVCVTSFAVTVDGATVVVHEGDMFAATHPIAKSHAELFASRDSHNVTTASPPQRRARKS